MLLDGQAVNNEDLAEAFANYFESKVNSLISNANINQSVYNGITKIRVNEENFMTLHNVTKAMKEIKLKNSEGCDRIPQRILLDGIEILAGPMTTLFNKIYLQKKLPEQWLMSVIIPVHKKGKKDEITNYRPVANLCSGSKIFEKLILNRIY